MSAYLPEDTVDAVGIASMLMVNVGWGFFLSRLPVAFARPIAWATLITGVVCVHLLLLSEPAGFRMMGLIGMALLGMKTIVVIEAQARGMTRLNLRRWLGFSMGWLGMQPRLFAERRQLAHPGAARLIAKGMTWVLVGSVFGLSARWASAEYENYWLTVFLLLVGLSLILHFGLCNLLAGAWRLFGVHTDSLFRGPLLSQSLVEFWGRRWNLAFSEMTSVAVYRPLALRFGRGLALLFAFLASGLLHEMAITLPVQAGLGLPLCYFAMHGALVFAERMLESRGVRVGGTWGRVWTFFWVVAPLPVLFHRPFLNGVVLPIIGSA